MKKHTLHRIRQKLAHLCLHPIHIYCLHHVCAKFDVSYMHIGDYMLIDDFKYSIMAMQNRGVEFISLSEAFEKLLSSKSFFSYRLEDYAVLTFDDGYASLNEVLPWLIERNIPATLFVNAEYAMKRAFRDTPQEKYLTTKEIQNWTTSGKGLIQIGMHGLQHIDVSTMSEREFNMYADKTIEATSQIIGYVPFWAYTWGRHNVMVDSVLRSKNIVPVLTDGLKNYSNFDSMHRELLTVR